MAPAPSAILEERPPAAGTPAVTVRAAGDRAVLVEYGEMEFDLALNFLVLAVDSALRARTVEGLVETAPGFRSILVTYEPRKLGTRELLEQLDAVHEQLEGIGSMRIPSRIVRLPVAFDDSQTRAAVERYANSIRADAPNCEGGTNVDYVVRYNGLRDREELYASVLASEQWTAFIGFFPGLPFMFPLDPRHAVFVPKYNPTRTWTPEGALGLGGPCFAIYPVESAGGYQLVGRTLPIYDLDGGIAAFRGDPLLLRPGDRVSFYRVDEDELLGLREDVRSDRFRYEIEDEPLDVGRYLEWTAAFREETAERRARRERAAAEAPVP